MADALALADYRVLAAHFDAQLRATDAATTFRWLADVLAAQPPQRRASNVTLMAWTGQPKALDWLETAVDSPVGNAWGTTAALLGVTWPRLVGWLEREGAHLLMALDALVAYRPPAANMASLAQIAAATLPDPPDRASFEATLGVVERGRISPRIARALESIRFHADHLLAGEPRAVPVADLPRLWLDPDAFPGARAILDHQRVVLQSVDRMIHNVLDGKPPGTSLEPRG